MLPGFLASTRHGICAGVCSCYYRVHLNLSNNHLAALPREIAMLKKLVNLDVSLNRCAAQATTGVPFMWRVCGVCAVLEFWALKKIRVSGV